MLASSETSRYELRRARARSSAEEHYLDMVGVTGSIPVAPTINPCRSYFAEAIASILSASLVSLTFDREGDRTEASTAAINHFEIIELLGKPGSLLLPAVLSHLREHAASH